jgi:Family of unknown function (DUF5996)
VAGHPLRQPAGADHLGDPVPAGAFDLEFDFVDHLLRIRASDGDSREVVLEPKPVAWFYVETMDALANLDVPTHIWATRTRWTRRSRSPRTTGTPPTSRMRRSCSDVSSCRLSA